MGGFFPAGGQNSAEGNQNRKKGTKIGGWHQNSARPQFIFILPALLAVGRGRFLFFQAPKPPEKCPPPIEFPNQQNPPAEKIPPPLPSIFAPPPCWGTPINIPEWISLIVMECSILAKTLTINTDGPTRQQVTD